MQRLLQSGASVLLVSHALDQVIRFCDDAIWLDRGQIVMRGPSTEVVKAYERFIRQLDDQRLRARNRKTASGRFDAFDRDTYTDQFIVEVEAAGAMPIEVSRMTLLRDGEAEDRVVVGAPQDADASQSAAVVPATGWTEPQSRRLGAAPLRARRRLGTRTVSSLVPVRHLRVRSRDGVPRPQPAAVCAC